MCCMFAILANIAEPRPPVVGTGLERRREGSLGPRLGSATRDWGGGERLGSRAWV